MKLTRLWLALALPAAAAPTAQQIEFFESHIRPVLAQECYECHSESGKRKGGLLLDSRPGWQAGGDTGAAILPGNPETSLLLQSIRHSHADIKMPKNGAKLDQSVIADFERWIAEGAPDPRDQAPSAEQLAQDTDWSAVLQRRKQWWCFQPVKPGRIDANASPQRVAAEIDRQLQAELEAQGLKASGLADAATLIRRASYILTGLPPTPSEIEAFAAAYQKSPAVYEQLVDRLLASPRYGERWARHWLDWVRYAESYGSEGDPRIPYVWRYRDYVIRAFNDDVPYPQMLREAIAGDLLPAPRIRNGINESALGIGQLRMVLHGFSPTDSLDELVTFTDNQIDTITKAFQALTVSCARCHNHKFDAISQSDFYALYGILTNTRPAVIDVNAPDTGESERAELRQIKKQIQSIMASAWEKAAQKIPGQSESKPAENPPATQVWDLKRDPWFVSGAGVRQGYTNPGEFSVALEGDEIIARLYPGGIFSDLISTKDRGVVMSKRFKCEGGTLWMRTAGGGGVKAKYVVQNYPRTGTIHRAKEHREKKDEELGWHRLDLNYWKGDDLFLQVSTVADMPAEFKEDARSWFGITQAFITHSDTPPPAVGMATDPVAAVAAWKAGAMTDAQAELLASLLSQGRLPNDSRAVPEAAAWLTRYREIEARLPKATRAPGVLEADNFDAPLFVRGDHKQPADKVARRFLEAIDPVAYSTRGSGRLELAESLAKKDNPLTYRVIVNRLWHHVFGRGLVGTPDNFGRLGELPSHPELLDALAAYFESSGGSMKRLIKALLLTQAFQRSREASTQALEKDPENRWLSHWTVRRLEAEAIRDSILMLSGKLDERMYGQSVGGKTERRSLYVNVIRNDLEPFLSAFDMPVPSSTRGRRDVTNVPAQSLALLNDPTIMNWSAAWARQVVAKSDEASKRVQQLFMQSLGRSASEQEVTNSLAFVSATVEHVRARKRELENLEERRRALRAKIQSVLEPTRARLLTKRPASQHEAPHPFAEWTFDTDGRDEQQRLPLKLEGGARVADGALILDGRTALARSAPLPQRFTSKTLEAWLMLDTLEQKGGGVLTMQDRRGSVFDAIVYAERSPGEWLSGSDYHRRTQAFNGPADTEADKRPVHVAITYDDRGRITGYCDGEPYGESYDAKEVIGFEAGTSEILLGCRHGGAGGNRMLRGRILRARLYDRALTADEIARSHKLENTTVTEKEILLALDEHQRREVETARRELETIAKESAVLDEKALRADVEVVGWESLALSLINLKEFIYLR